MEDKYTAIIVEPRKFPSFEFVLDNFLSNLDDKWIFMIYCGSTNQTWVENIINTKFDKYKHKITLKQLGVDNLTSYDYNKLMISVDFLKEIPTEVFLLFQTDSIICQNNKSLINDFLKYDYVGAPWRDNAISYLIDQYPILADRYNKVNNENGFVGNGGLSLRRKSKMLEIVNNCPYPIGLPEDVYFSIACKDIVLNKPPIELAKSFSMESISTPVSFGVHRTWNYTLDNLDKQCPNYSTLAELNNQKLNIEEYTNYNEQTFFNVQFNLYLIIIIIIILILCIIFYNKYKHKLSLKN